jgi:hypothetical protein
MIKYYLKIKITLTPSIVQHYLLWYSSSSDTQDTSQHNQNSHTLDPEHIDENQPHTVM